MFNILSHQRNANQNNTEIPSYTYKNGQDYKHIVMTAYAGEVMKTILHWLWKCKLVQPLLKSVWRFFRKLENNLPQDPAISLLGI